MKTLKNFLPTGFGIIIGLATGLATNDIATGIALAVIFSLTSRYKASCSSNK